MEPTEGKRRLSSAGEDVRREFISKRVRSIDGSNSSWNFIDESSIGSMSQSISFDLLSGSQTSQDSSVDIDLERPDTDESVQELSAGAEQSEFGKKFEFPETVEMESQKSITDEHMFDETACFNGECDDDSSRCESLKQLSKDILSVNEDPKPESSNVGGVCDVLTYMHDVSEETQTKVADYLSSGNLSRVILTMENVHTFFHVAKLLHLKQLRSHCIKFCFESNQSEILASFAGCDCQTDIKQESHSGYQRSQSVVSIPDELGPPQYYVMFSRKVDENPEKIKVKVMVIDMSKKRSVFTHEVEKMRNFGDGFACCSFEVKGAPFIMVSGGVGKSSHLVMKYDILLGRWDKCPKLLHGRSSHMMIKSDSNSIFVIGGAEVPCIEEYVIESNKWCERASLITPVVSATCQVYQNKIYIFGGKTPAGSVATAQCYDIETHKISRLPDLPCAFDGGQAVVFKERIYIATDQGHMIRFNPMTGFSRLCTQQPVNRKQFGMFEKNDRIYLVGGVLCNDEESSVKVPQYRYNAEKDIWVEKYSMCYNFSVFASCIITYEKKCCVIPFNDKF